MSLRKTISGIVKYGIVLSIGYWAGGGCDTPKEIYTTESQMYPESQIEKKLNEYELRLKELEGKSSKSGVEKAYSFAKEKYKAGVRNAINALEKLDKKIESH